MSYSDELAFNRRMNARRLEEADARRRAIEEASVLAMFEAAAADENRPYTRVAEGYGPGMLLTRAQWANYDALAALRDGMERKCAGMFPKAFSSMRNIAGRIW